MGAAGMPSLFQLAAYLCIGVSSFLKNIVFDATYR